MRGISKWKRHDQTSYDKPATTMKKKTYVEDFEKIMKENQIKAFFLVSTLKAIESNKKKRTWF